MRKLLFLILLALLTSCSSSNEPVQTPTNIIDEKVEEFVNPEFEVVHAYQLYQSYFEKTLGNNQSEALFKEEVINPIFESCFKDGEYNQTAERLINVIPEDVDRYKHLIGTLDPKAVEAMVLEAMEKSSQLLPVKGKTTICIFPSTNKDAPATLTVGAGKIAVLYSGFHSENHIKTALAHEYHHSMWTKDYYDPNTVPTVLDQMIYEGKAVLFEKMVYPQLSFTTIYPEYHKNAWEIVERNIKETDIKIIHSVLNGGGDLPPFYGYSEGYKMVKALAMKENLSVEEWTAVPAQEVFERGNYTKNYK